MALAPPLLYSTHCFAEGVLLDILLASASPRRAELLEALGLSFTIVPAEVAERVLPGETPDRTACRLAAAKARAVSVLAEEALVVAADTLVVLDGLVLGKPRDAQQAVEMLLALRGREHLVHTGLAVGKAGALTLQLATSPVIMRDYSAAEIAAYVASGDPLDKAGAYGCQHPVFRPVETYGNCYANVMGLPLCHLYRLLAQLGATLPRSPLEACPWAIAHGGCAWSAAILQAPPTSWQHCPPA